MTGRPNYRPPPNRPDTAWQDDALCLTVGADFFPQQGSRTGYRAAKAVCDLCPVTAECLQYALEQDERWGVWGGMSEHQRRRLRPQRRRDSA